MGLENRAWCFEKKFCRFFFAEEWLEYCMAWAFPQFSRDERLLTILTHNTTADDFSIHNDESE